MLSINSGLWLTQTSGISLPGWLNQAVASKQGFSSSWWNIGGRKNNLIILWIKGCQALKSTSTLSRLGWTVLALTTVCFYRDEICLKTITGLPLLIFYNSLSYQQTPIMLISQGPCIMFSVNSVLANAHSQVLEETECTPRLFHEVPAYRSVRAKGASKEDLGISSQQQSRACSLVKGLRKQWPEWIRSTGPSAGKGWKDRTEAAEGHHFHTNHRAQAAVRQASNIQLLVSPLICEPLTSQQGAGWPASPADSVHTGRERENENGLGGRDERGTGWSERINDHNFLSRRILNVGRHHLWMVP